MPRARDILSALRAAAIWLLMVSVLFGPAGLGGSSASDSCPCDDDHDEAPCGEGSPEEHDAETPVDDECPEDCPSCSCGPGVAMTMSASMLPSGAPPSSPEPMSARSDAPSSGVRSGVFRPPRSLS